MKTKIIVFCNLLLAISCSPKLGTSIINKQKELEKDAYVLVLPLEDEQIISGVKIGEIKSGDSGFSSNCSYNEIIGPLKNLARENGANILKITKHKSPDHLSTCARIKADIYKVDDYRIYEKYIVWDENRKLRWEDFKGTPKPREYPNAAALTSCGFGFESNRVNVFKRTKMFVENIFYCESSWVLNDESKTDEILQHEQAHFDLSEVYSRILKRKLEELKLNVVNLEKETERIYEEVYKQYLEKQEQYDKETNHSTKTDEQIKWYKYIENQLNLTEARK